MLNRQVTTTALLGHESSAVEVLIGRAPDESFVSESGRAVLKYHEGDVREVHIDISGRVCRCNYTEERRARPRVTPAHFVSALLVDVSGDEVQGMVMDVAVNSVRIRLKSDVLATAGDNVGLDFSVPEGDTVHRVALRDAFVLRTSRVGEALHVILLFPEFPEEHPFAKYVNCRQSEIAFGKKLCVRNGGKCKADLVV